ncbi:RNA-binding cell elongation regulator Jag/EloR [Dethiothermospora halolimnae]|uniref:RNA-binding cell elongation regulator Jag/EloR n=1 Tax=Dethiothermospora halolimnae TaxID=3114390 RepID=UPI003CCC3782
MKSVVKVSKTVEGAIKEALEELDARREDTTIEVITEPSKGFLGLIGAKDAKVKVDVTNDPVDISNEFLKKVLSKIGVEADIDITRKKNTLNIDLQGVDSSDMGIIIGKRGNTLDSIQYLTSLAVNRDREKYIRIVLDAENYRQKREQTLIRLAKKMAAKAKSTKRKIKLEPMNPYERRIIHSTLQKDRAIETHSEGEEPYRKVVIELKRSFNKTQ